MAHQQETAAETRRFTAYEILQAALDNARLELERSNVKLGFSGVAGGITMGLSGLGVAELHAFLGSGGWKDLVSFLAYPIRLHCRDYWAGSTVHRKYPVPGGVGAG